MSPVCTIPVGGARRSPLFPAAPLSFHLSCHLSCHPERVRRTREGPYVAPHPQLQSTGPRANWPAGRSVSDEASQFVGKRGGRARAVEKRGATRRSPPPRRRGTPQS